MNKDLCFMKCISKAISAQSHAFWVEFPAGANAFKIVFLFLTKGIRNGQRIDGLILTWIKLKGKIKGSCKIFPWMECNFLNTQRWAQGQKYSGYTVHNERTLYGSVFTRELRWFMSTAHEFRHRGIIFSTFLSLPNFYDPQENVIVRSFSLKLRRFNGVLNHVFLNVSLEKQIR